LTQWICSPPSFPAEIIGADHARTVPALIAVAGDRASLRFLEIFAANIRNPHTRRAYSRAVTDFLAWCDDNLENSHRPTRRRERQMQRFKSSEQAQDFLSAHSMIYGHFRPRRHLLAAAGYRKARAKAFRIWRQETCVQPAA
jgi:hypothetical protein